MKGGHVHVLIPPHTRFALEEQKSPRRRLRNFPRDPYRQKNCFSVSENIFQVLLKSQFVSQLPRFITEQATLPICGPPERLRFPCTRPEVRCKHRRQRRGSFGPLSYRALLSYVQCIRTVYMYRSWFRFRYRCCVSESVLGALGFKAQMRGGYVGLRVGWLVVSFGHGAYCVGRSEVPTQSARPSQSVTLCVTV